MTTSKDDDDGIINDDAKTTLLAYRLRQAIRQLVGAVRDVGYFHARVCQKLLGASRKTIDLGNRLCNHLIGEDKALPPNDQSNA